LGAIAIVIESLEGELLGSWVEQPQKPKSLFSIDDIRRQWACDRLIFRDGLGRRGDRRRDRWRFACRLLPCLCLRLYFLFLLLPGRLVPVDQLAATLADAFPFIEFATAILQVARVNSRHARCFEIRRRFFAQL
jgi:hypothetical protein